MRLDGIGSADPVIRDSVGGYVGVEEGRYDTDSGLFLGEGGGEDEADCEEAAVPFCHWTAEVDLDL